MAKRQTAQEFPSATELTVNKEDFKTGLTEHLKEGQRLFAIKIETNQDLAEFKTHYKGWVNYVSEYLKYSFNNPDNEYRKKFNEEGYSFLGRIGQFSNEVEDYKDLIQLRMNNLQNLIRTTDLLRQSTFVTSSITETANKTAVIEKTEVFIVHGHDEEAKIKAARFIEQLGFKPIILHEQASSGNTIIEKIEQHTNVGFGIVLYTPCDLGAKKSAEPMLRDRARQNVVFEHGYLIGKIGRRNVCALVKGNVETPTDISGVVYIPMDDAGAWHIAIARELRSSGYNVDMNKVI
jgi:predicted nucleotide-binding protein